MLNEADYPDMPTGLQFDRDGLIPVIVQEDTTNDVLMLAFMNEEALQRTLETGLVHFWSRSRQKLWQKGETSGHVQEVVSLAVNCENNSLLLRVHQRGNAACHEGFHSCYFRTWTGGGKEIWEVNQPRLFDPAEVYASPSNDNAARSAGILPTHRISDATAGPSEQPPSRSAGILPAHPSAGADADTPDKRSPCSAGILPAHPSADAIINPSEQPHSRSAGILPAHRPANAIARDANQSSNTSLNLTDQETSSRARGYLPHWEQKSATYFVTFRLADALPAQTLLAYEAERAALLKKQKSKGELSAEEKKRLGRLLSERIQQYLDTGAGACHLANPAIARIVADALCRFNGTRYQLLCWCIMPNHVHVIVRPLEAFKLTSIIHSWKSFTALEANRFLGSKGDFWQREYYDHLVRDEQDFQRLVEYVVNNPIKAHLENWQWVGVYDAYPEQIRAESSVAMGRRPAGAANRHLPGRADIPTSLAMGRQDTGAAEAPKTLAEAFQRIYRAYEYLRDHDLEEVSGTSRRLRHPDLAWLRQRAAQELGELAGVLDGTHVHTNPTADTILEGRQVCYWLMTQAVAQHLTFEQVMPHIHLRAGFEGGKAVAEAAAELFAREERALLDDLSAGLYLVGGACRQQGVSLLALAEAELADLRQKSYLPSDLLSSEERGR